MQHEQAQRVIVYFHENAGSKIYFNADIGTRIYFLKELSKRTQSNVILVAYRGYSDSDSVPS